MTDFPAPPLDWQSDEDCLRVAAFICDWIMAEDAHEEAGGWRSLRDNLKRTTCYDLVDDLLITLTDDRFTGRAKVMLEQIGDPQ